jgi:hypothetical protein
MVRLNGLITRTVVTVSAQQKFLACRLEVRARLTDTELTVL